MKKKKEEIEVAAVGGYMSQIGRKGGKAGAGT